MTEERFHELLAIAKKAYHDYHDDAGQIAGHIGGAITHPSIREYRQAINLLSLDTSLEQWILVEDAMARKWP